MNRAECRRAARKGITASNHQREKQQKVKQMKIVRNQLYRRVFDPFLIQRELDQVAKEFMASGWEVKRGILGTVILELQDGEVHYVPTDRGIDEVVLERG